jgi:hypothetical protein
MEPIRFKHSSQLHENREIPTEYLLRYLQNTPLPDLRINASDHTAFAAAAHQEQLLSSAARTVTKQNVQSNKFWQVRTNKFEPPPPARRAL